MDAQDSTVVSVAAADDTLNEGASAPVAGAEAGPWGGAGFEMEIATDAGIMAATLEASETVDEGVAPMEVWDEALEELPTAAAVATETVEAAGAEAEGARVRSQQAGAGETTPFAAADASRTVALCCALADESGLLDGATLTAMEPQPEPPDVLLQAAVQAGAEAFESRGIVGTLSPAAALEVAEAALDELFHRYPCDACALLEALRSALSTRRDDALLLVGTTAVGEQHAAPATSHRRSTALCDMTTQPAIPPPKRHAAHRVSRVARAAGGDGGTHDG